jgi:hypothetical protein
MHSLPRARGGGHCTVSVTMFSAVIPPSPAPPGSRESGSSNLRRHEYMRLDGILVRTPGTDYIKLN